MSAIFFQNQIFPGRACRASTWVTAVKHRLRTREHDREDWCGGDERGGCLIGKHPEWQTRRAVELLMRCPYAYLQWADNEITLLWPWRLSLRNVTDNNSILNFASYISRVCQTLLIHLLRITSINPLVNQIDRTGSLSPCLHVQCNPSFWHLEAALGVLQAYFLGWGGFLHLLHKKDFYPWLNLKHRFDPSDNKWVTLFLLVETDLAFRGNDKAENWEKQKWRHAVRREGQRDDRLMRGGWMFMMRHPAKRLRPP